MHVDLTSIVKKALETDCNEFIQLVEDAINLLSKEDGDIGNLNIRGRLAELKPKGKALIIGDLHGDLESLIGIFKKSNFLQKMEKNSNATLIFLGDYGDRGPYSTETYYIVLKLKTLLPKQIVLMRGNHEGPDDLMASPHDLPAQFQVKFGERWADTYSKIRALWAYLYDAVLVKGRYLMIHGGLSSQARTAEDLAYAHIKHPKERLLEDMLWSDPNETIREECASPRGAGKFFGEKVTRETLKRFGVKILIRGHESCEDGFRIAHRGRILTLFSRKGPPYFNAHGAYLEIELSKIFDSAEQLILYIHKF